MPRRALAILAALRKQVLSNPHLPRHRRSRWKTDCSYEGGILSCVRGWSSHEVLAGNILNYAQPFYTLSRVRFGDFISKQPRLARGSADKDICSLMT